MQKFYTNVFNQGNYIYVRGFDEDGERIQKTYTYEPYLFVKENKDSPYKDIHGNNVRQINFDNIRDARDFVKKYNDIDGMQIYGYDRWAYTYIYDNYRNCDYDASKMNIVYIDIEVQSDDGFPEPKKAEKEVTAVCLIRGDMRIVLGIGDYEHDDKNTYYLKCDNEIMLLRKFLKVWENLDMDVLSGWNSEFFDIPYMYNRISKLLGEEHAKRMSPWGKVREYTMNQGIKEQQGYELYGISHLDYLAVYKKFCLAPRESYRLDYIAQLELGENKIDYSEYGNLYTLNRENHQKFIEYNIHDTVLVQRLEEQLGYMNVIFALTYDSGCNHNDGLSTLTIWDTIIHNYLMEQNIVIPAKKNDRKDFPQIAGGYVKDPQVGMHDWVMSFDLNSLYPHLIMQYNISPDTMSKKTFHFDENKLRELYIEKNMHTNKVES
jgi:DNA polymerase elongation subunit (family B)